MVGCQSPFEATASVVDSPTPPHRDLAYLTKYREDQPSRMDPGAILRRLFRPDPRPASTAFVPGNPLLRWAPGIGDVHHQGRLLRLLPTTGADRPRFGKERSCQRVLPSRVPPQTGRSGKGLGIAATALAVVIAAGFVFAINQGNEVTGSAEPSGPAQAAERHADRVGAQAQAESHPGFNIEKTKMELANQVAAVNEHPGLNIEKTKMELASQVAAVNEYPGLNPERTKMELAGPVSVVSEYPGLNPEKARMEMLYRQARRADLRAEHRAADRAESAEWDNRIP